MSDWDEDAYCRDEAARLQAAIDDRQWLVIEKTIDRFCHERLTVQPMAVGICSFEVEAVVPEEVWMHNRRRGEPLKPPLAEWPPAVQEKALVLANHVLERLRSGQTGC